MSFFIELRNLIRLILLPKHKRRIVFYSENRNYWAHLEGMVNEILNNTNLYLCYISSNNDDPGLLINHPKYNSFKIDEGSIRNWLFKNIDTDVFVMTMPSLEKYQIKRSRFPVHYIYTQHSLNSLHMVYEKSAFDFFDTIFCVGPHHIKEIQAMEKIYQLPKKNLIKHGYYRLESIANMNQKLNKYNNKNKHILLAPSWGKNGLIETIGEKVIDKLLKQSFKITLRPHPQTLKFAKEKINEILKKFDSNPNFKFDSNVENQDSLHESDVLISDWSGTSFEYYFALKKPVFFLDLPKKINNPDYKEIGIEPFESYMRTKVGTIITLDDLEDFNKFIKINDKKIDISEYIYSFGKSSAVGVDAINRILEDKGLVK